MSEPASRPAGRRPLRVPVAILLGTLLSWALLEGALQVAALFVEGSRAGEEGASLVLCHGDSNTFGLYLTAERSYPAQLEGLLRERYRPDARVVNCGLPGKTTWIVRQQLAEDMARYTPRAVVLLAGINDCWALRPDPAELEAGPDEAPAAEASPGFFASLRTVKLARILLSRADQEAADSGSEAPDGPDDPAAQLDGQQAIWVDPEDIQKLEGTEREIAATDRTGAVRPFRLVGGLPGAEEYQRWIEEDWVAAAELIRSRDAVPILLCYPSEKGVFPAVNEAVVRAAESSGARLVDARAAFARAEAQVGREALLYEDGHPTELGYSILARLVLQALEEEGVVPAGDPIDPFERVHAWQAPELGVRVWCEGGEVRGLEARYAPGFGATLLAAEAPGTVELIISKKGVVRVAGEDERGRPVPLARDLVFKHSVRNQVTPPQPFLDEDWMRVPLPDTGPGERDPSSLVGVLLIQGPGRVFVEVTEPIPLRCP